MTVSFYALLLGFLLDAVIGDPHSIPHPVIWIGKLISFCEKWYRRLLPATPRGELAGGILLVITVLLFSAGIPWILLWAAGMVHPLLLLVLESVMCWQVLAAKSLRTESMKVYHALSKGDTEAARYAVSMIVGRDTAVLDEEGITRAAVETVAENTSDGVIAPMLYCVLGGPVLGFLYKAINTMDSMVAYKNDRYLYFGRAAAILDDIANAVPARFSALLMILCSPLCGLDGKNAWKIFRRDRYKHASPNSAQTESVCAGALRIRLAGDAWYGGVLHKKETIGDDLRPIEYEDIRRANRLMYSASVLGLLLFSLCKGAVILIGGGGLCW